MLRELLDDAEKHDEKAMVELIERFSPLFKKYALKLGYEDAYEDIILWFIELVKSGKLASLQEKVIVSYIQVSVMNYYNKKIRKIIESRKEIVLSDLSEEHTYLIEAKIAKEDRQDLFWELNVIDILNKSELQLLRLSFYYGYSIAEIARISGKSRQAVNQKKKRALKKLEKELRKDDGGRS